MVYSLGYRRPSRVADGSWHAPTTEKPSSAGGMVRTGTSDSSRGIPDELSFDRIISGASYPPCTTRDFLNYLKYVEYNAENLQFFLWYKDYCDRFEKLPSSQRSLAPEWTEIDPPRQAHKSKKTLTISSVSEVFAQTPKVEIDSPSPFDDPTRTILSTIPVSPHSGYSFSFTEKTLTRQADFDRKAEEALDEVGMGKKPLPSQPFRNELARIVSIYIANDGSRQLNLSEKERIAVLCAFENTTHPSALLPAVMSVEYMLRHQGHPNFIRWTICNGNRPRILFARCLGVSLIIAGILGEILVTLSPARRVWRVLPTPILLIGIATLAAAWKGMCIVLHSFHQRHVRPWELFGDPEEDLYMTNMDNTSSSNDCQLKHSCNTSDSGEKNDSSDDGDKKDHSNSYEDEPWVAKYEGRNLARKIFDRQISIQEPALRKIQDIIVIQSLILSLVLTCVIVGIFCAIPYTGKGLL